MLHISIYFPIYYEQHWENQRIWYSISHFNVCRPLYPIHFILVFVFLLNWIYWHSGKYVDDERAKKRRLEMVFDSQHCVVAVQVIEIWNFSTFMMMGNCSIKNIEFESYLCIPTVNWKWKILWTDAKFYISQFLDFQQIYIYAQYYSFEILRNYFGILIHFLHVLYSYTLNIVFSLKGNSKKIQNTDREKRINK